MSMYVLVQKTKDVLVYYDIPRLPLDQNGCPVKFLINKGEGDNLNPFKRNNPKKNDFLPYF